MLVYETMLDCPLVMCLTPPTKGKTMKEGTIRRKESSEGLGAIGIDFVREIWERVWEFMFGIRV